MSDAERMEERLRAAVAAHFERAASNILYGESASTVADPEADTLTPKKWAAMLDECGKLLRNARREQVTLVVDMGHEGPMIRHKTPCDGTRIECTWSDAQRLHEHWPFRLHSVVSEECAEFVPASPWDGFIPKILPMPPFDLPPSLEEIITPDDDEPTP